jgi:class 3 adenylate cyclase/tetratricopeptide (TPR) repeat protein
MAMMQRVVCPVLIGRDTELAVLEDALLAADRGEGRVVVLAGDAGMGKTRLTIELERRVARLGWTAMSGGCSEADISLPYLPFLQAIGNHLAGVDIGQARTALGAAAGELAHLFPQLSDERISSDASDPAQAKLRLFEAILSYLRFAARDRGLLLVTEDLHWADGSTRELLDYMTRRLRNTRILLLATYRSDEMHRRHPLLPIVQGWRRSGLAELVELAPLAAPSVAAMLCAIFDEQQVSEDFRDLMHARSEGNPFVLEEILKESVDHGDIFVTDTGWDRKALEELRIPRTVADSILLRVGRLDPAHAQILRAAAVIGPSFDYRLLADVCLAPAADVREALATCVREQLLEEDASSGGYRFRHALTREAVYSDLIQPERAELHSRTADALQRNNGGAAIELARHLAAADRWDEAVPRYLAMAEEASRQLAFLDAAKLYERVLPRLGAGDDRAMVLSLLGGAYHLGGRREHGERLLEEGIRLLDEAGRVAEAAHFRLQLGRSRWERGEEAIARDHYERARRDLEGLGASHDLAVAYLRLGGLAEFELEGADGLVLNQRALTVAEEAGADAARIWAYNFLGGCLTLLGRLDEGLAYIDRSLHEAHERGLHNIATNAMYNGSITRIWELRAAQALEMMRTTPLPAFTDEDFCWRNLIEGACRVCLGDLTAAATNTLTAVELADRLQLRVLGSRAAAQHALALAEMGSVAEAVEVLTTRNFGDVRQDLLYNGPAVMRTNLLAGRIGHAVAMAERVITAREHLNLLLDPVAHAVEVLLVSGRGDDARELVDNAAAIAFDKNDPRLLLAVGRLALADGDPVLAERSLRAAAEGFAAVGYRVHEIRARLAFAGASAELGRKGEAIAALRAAHELTVACGARVLETEVVERLTALGESVETRSSLTSEAPVTAPPDMIATGERLVTVLFADVRGYTRITAQLAPAELADRIGTFQRWVRHELERRHGVVDKFAGDAVMATFNVGGVSIDHTVHALQAALAIVDKAALLELPVGVGIAVGSAIVGRLVDGGNVSVLGEATNLAARLQALAGGGEVLLDAQATRRVDGWLAERGINATQEQLAVKGVDAPVQVARIQHRTASQT